jgi:hypothetical protein
MYDARPPLFDLENKLPFVLNIELSPFDVDPKLLKILGGESMEWLVLDSSSVVFVSSSASSQAV